MSPLPRPIEKTSRWVYRGVWRVLVRQFHVPEGPPTLPAAPGEVVESFGPDEGFLRYLKVLFWVSLVPSTVALVIGWVAATIASPLTGAILAVPAILLVIVPPIVAYVAIYLRFDTTWYVMTGRSLRIRRGIWIIHETTITFENVQNVTVSQGPLQRIFGISDVHVDTAGGGGKAEAKHGGLDSGHRGIIEGIRDAARIRDLILARLRKSQSAGLGDESAHKSRPTWTAGQTALLREIRDVVRQMGHAPS